MRLYFQIVLPGPLGSPRERQDSVGPTVFDLGMGTSIELPSVMTALPKAEIPVIVGGEVTRWSLELYNHHWDLIRASGS